jgi:hypothetical protein
MYPSVLLRKRISADINLFSSVLLIAMLRFHKTVLVLWDFKFSRRRVWCS